MPAINWYPGHMAKTRRMLIENLKMIDVVVELIDARAPLASRNPDFDDLFFGRARVVLLNKSDLADPQATKRWISYYASRGVAAAGISATGGGAKKTAVTLIERAAKPKVDAMRLKGINKTVRCMVVGIPNVGKSTFINRMAGEARAEVGDKPGVTRGKQWVRITPYLELMDTPGMLWPKLENQELAAHLAYLGSIKDEIMDSEALALELLHLLKTLSPAALAERYSKLTPETPKEELLDAVCLSRGFLLKGGALDTERAAHVALDEFRAGKIGRVTLELPAARS
ncbi:MAG: ribosome biogenesis GTPase YlqF [Clostridiaceae bacterium]